MRGTRKMDGEEGTDAGVAAAAAWLSRAASWVSVTQTVPTHSSSAVMRCAVMLVLARQDPKLMFRALKRVLASRQISAYKLSITRAIGGVICN